MNFNSANQMPYKWSGSTLDRVVIESPMLADQLAKGEVSRWRKKVKSERGELVVVRNKEGKTTFELNPGPVVVEGESYWLVSARDPRSISDEVYLIAAIDVDEGQDIWQKSLHSLRIANRRITRTLSYFAEYETILGRMKNPDSEGLTYIRDNIKSFYSYCTNGRQDMLPWKEPVTKIINRVVQQVYVGLDREYWLGTWIGDDPKEYLENEIKELTRQIKESSCQIEKSDLAVRRALLISAKYTLINLAHITMNYCADKSAGADITESDFSMVFAVLKPLEDRLRTRMDEIIAQNHVLINSSKHFAAKEDLDTIIWEAMSELWKSGAVDLFKNNDGIQIIVKQDTDKTEAFYEIQMLRNRLAKLGQTMGAEDRAERLLFDVVAKISGSTPDRPISEFSDGGRASLDQVIRDYTNAAKVLISFSKRNPEVYNIAARNYAEARNRVTEVMGEYCAGEPEIAKMLSEILDDMNYMAKSKRPLHKSLKRKEEVLQEMGLLSESSHETPICMHR